MSRRRLVRQNEFPYHVTSRSNNKEWFKAPLIDVWNFCKEAFYYAQSRYPVQVHCFVLMSNHYHLLVTTPDSNIDKFVMLFNLKLSKQISQSTSSINHRFSNRYKWTIIDNYNYLLNVYRYIYQNPIRAGITENVACYPYSSIHFSEKEREFLKFEPHISYEKHKSWFERRFDNDLEIIISKSLKKEVFKISKRVSKHNQQLLLNSHFM